MKIIRKKKITDPYVIKHLHREAKILQKLSHPNIIQVCRACRRCGRMRAVWPTPAPASQLYEVIETEDDYVLVMEQCSGGEVLDYIVAHGRLKEKEARKFTRQILSALDHMHQQGIVHRDIKPENLLLDANLNVKIIDFGLSNFYDGKTSLKTRCGSFEYSAPELIGSKPHVGSEIDLFTLGVNLYAMLTGELPFQSDNITVVYHMQLRQQYRMPSVSESCQQLLRRLLNPDPKERATHEELRKVRARTHPRAAAARSPAASRALPRAHSRRGSTRATTSRWRRTSPASTTAPSRPTTRLSRRWPRWDSTRRRRCAACATTSSTGSPPRTACSRWTWRSSTSSSGAASGTCRGRCRRTRTC